MRRSVAGAAPERRLSKGLCSGLVKTPPRRPKMFPRARLQQPCQEPSTKKKLVDGAYPRDGEISGLGEVHGSQLLRMC